MPSICSFPFDLFDLDLVYFQATTLYCLVTEYACGGELLAFIKQQENSRLTESHARKFARQLVSALQFLHERGVVHRYIALITISVDTVYVNGTVNVPHILYLLYIILYNSVLFTLPLCPLKQ